MIRNGRFVVSFSHVLATRDDKHTGMFRKITHFPQFLRRAQRSSASTFILERFTRRERESIIRIIDTMYDHFNHIIARVPLAREVNVKLISYRK